MNIYWIYLFRFIVWKLILSFSAESRLVEKEKGNYLPFIEPTKYLALT